MHAAEAARSSTRQWRNTREIVFQIYGRRCWQRGAPATHIDHLTPVARGGADAISNLRPACAACNLAKGAG